MKKIEKIENPNFLKLLNLDDLNELSQSIRSFLIKNVVKTGGHLGANLGIVELTLALHKVFQSPIDKIIWDVGHQSYVHKILTGQAGKFSTLRQYKGLSGFQQIYETKHDYWGSGHSSTSISAALGMAIARDLNDKEFEIISVIGDGALTGGMSFEALNHLGYLKKNLKIVLNDNKMSISKNVGALQKSLNFSEQNNKAKDFFASLGIHYIGPIDGHCLKTLIQTFKQIKEIKEPVVIHVLTEKGKGYLQAERDEATRLHSVSAIKEEKDHEEVKDFTKNSWSEVVSNKLLKLAKDHKKFVILTPAMIVGSKLEQFSRKYPNRIFDTAISEQHTVTLSGGLAVQGIKPIVTIYSTFLQRAYDQVIHDICRQNLPVFFCIDRAGLVGEDGPTHHGVFDIAFLRTIPNLIIMMPSTKEECEAMIHFGLNYNDHPIAIRFPRGKEMTNEDLQLNDKIEILDQGLETFSWRILKKGKDLALLTFGPHVSTALKVASFLEKKYCITVSVIDTRFIKPLDFDILNDLIKENIPLLIIEEGMKAGGFSSAVLEYIVDSPIQKGKLNIERIGIEDTFIEQGSVDKLYEITNLTEGKIIEKAEKILQKEGTII